MSDDANALDALDARDAPGADDYRQLFEALPGAYLVLRPDAPHFTIVAVTDAYLAAMHVARDAVVGRGLLDVIANEHPDDRARAGLVALRGSLEIALRTRRPHRMADEHTADDATLDATSADARGTARSWATRNVPVLGDDGTVRFLLHGVDDVTERTRAEAGERAARAATDAMDVELRREREQVRRDRTELRQMHADAVTLREHSNTLRRGLRELLARSEELRARPLPRSPADAVADATDATDAAPTRSERGPT